MSSIPPTPIVLQRPGRTEVTFAETPLGDQIQIIFGDGEPWVSIEYTWVKPKLNRLPKGSEHLRELVQRANAVSSQEYFIDTERWADE